MSSVLSLARARVEDSLTTSQVRHVQLINDQQTVPHESFLNLAPTREALLLESSRLWFCLFLCVHLFTLAPLYASSFYPLMLNCLLFFFFLSLVFFLKKKTFGCYSLAKVMMISPLSAPGAAQRPSHV